MLAYSKHVEGWIGRPDDEIALVADGKVPVVFVFAVDGGKEDGGG